MEVYVPPHKRNNVVLRNLDSLPKLPTEKLAADHIAKTKNLKYTIWLRKNGYLVDIYKLYIEKYFEDISLDRFTRFIFELENQTAYSEWKNKFNLGLKLKEDDKSKNECKEEDSLENEESDTDEVVEKEVANENDTDFNNIYMIAVNIRRYCENNYFNLGNIRNFENKFMKFVSNYC